MTKDFKQQLADLESGLNSIQRTINNPKNLIQHRKAIEAKHIQDARIDFFKRGYNLRDRELKEQKKLRTESKQNASLEEKDGEC